MDSVDSSIISKWPSIGHCCSTLIRPPTARYTDSSKNALFNVKWRSAGALGKRGSGSFNLCTVVRGFIITGKTELSIMQLVRLLASCYLTVGCRHASNTSQCSRVLWYTLDTEKLHSHTLELPPPPSLSPSHRAFDFIDHRRVTCQLWSFLYLELIVALS